MPQGPVAYRRAVRTLGPVVGLAPAAVLGALAWLLHSGGGSAMRGLSGFGLAVLAAPGLLVMGVPLTSGSGVYLAGIGLTAVVWLAFGVIASRRATRRPAAGWREYWREFLWLAVPLWVGVLLALLVVDLVAGRPVL